MEDLEICHRNDPKQPVLVSHQRILGDPFTWCIYLSSETEVSSSSSSTDKPSDEIDRPLVTEAQAICFLNEVLLPHDPLNKTLFDAKSMSTCQVYRLLVEYCSCLDNKSLNAFARWCSSRKIKFLQADPVRKRPKHGAGVTSRYRTIYAMKKEYLDSVVSRITNYLPAYHVFLRKLKMEGYEVIGYARKSLGPEDSSTRARLLQSMIDKLKERSLTSKVFVSPNSPVSQLFCDRDIYEDTEVLEKLVGIEGTTHDLITCLETTKKDICLVSLDFAGLSTNSTDVRKLIRDHPRLKKIVVDSLPIKHELQVFEREKVLEDPLALQIFDECRKPSIQRSK